MSILWCGGEDIDFPVRASDFVIAASGFRAGYARCTISDVGSGWAYSNAFTSAVTNCWMSFRTSDPWTTSKLIIGLGNYSTGNTNGVFIGSSATNAGQIALFKNGIQVAAESGISMSSTIIKIDIHIQSLGASCTVNVYVGGNSSPVITYTGDMTISGVPNIDRVLLVPGSGVSMGISEIIVAEEDTRLMSLVTLAPAAAGDASEWTNGYANIDEITSSDADVIYTETGAANFQCNLTGMPAGDFSVKGVKFSARLVDGVGGMGVKQGIKTNSTLSLGNTIVLDTVWNTHESLYQQNPVTASRFTPTEIENLQFALQSVAL